MRKTLLAALAVISVSVLPAAAGDDHVRSVPTPRVAAAALDEQQQLALKLVKPTGNPIADVKSAIEGGSTGGPLSNISSALSSPTNPLAGILTDLANFIGDDATAAAALAVEIPELQDVNGQACWLAMQVTGKVFKAHPVPATLKLMTDHEAVRLLVMSANKLCANTACTVVFADAANVTQAASPITLVIPSLQQVCSKIAQLAPPITGLAPATSLITAPVITPTPAPVPAGPAPGVPNAAPIPVEPVTPSAKP